MAMHRGQFPSLWVFKTPKDLLPAGPKYNDNDFDHVIANQTFTTRQDLDGAGDDNTLFRNNVIHDTASGVPGLLFRNVKGCVAWQNEIYNVGHGIQFSVTAPGGSNCIVDDNNIHDVDHDGISTAERVGTGACTGTNWLGLKFMFNRIHNTGREASPPFGRHSIYAQVHDIEITDNIITGVRHFHGISVRTSGIVMRNQVSGNPDDANARGIQYFSDHTTGLTDLLRIEDNIVVMPDAHDGIGLFNPANRACDSSVPNGHVVKNFTIKNNTITVDTGTHIDTDAEYDSAPFDLTVSGNTLL